MIRVPNRSLRTSFDRLLSLALKGLTWTAVAVAALVSIGWI